MHNWKIARRLSLGVIVLIVAAVAGYATIGLGAAASPSPTTVKPGSLPGMASLSGSVDAPIPFKAAQVYVHNVDKRIMYMVYTNAGQFRSVALFPGNYEVSVVGKGLESDVQKLTLKAGDSQKLKFSLRQSSRNLLPLAQGLGVPTSATPTSADGFQKYDDIYPPGPGRDVLERTCMLCHGEDFLPTQPASAAQWNARIDHMMAPDVVTGVRPAVSYAQGLLQYRDPRFRFSKPDRDILVDYMAKNFGEDSKERAVRIEKEMPLDEQKLGKAMYVEYYLGDDPPGQLSKAPDGERRYGQDVRFDTDGNVWLTDRGIPERLIKLDPRTGQQKEYLVPDPKNGNHEVNIDRSGMIWLPEHAGLTPSKVKHLNGFNPKTGEWEYQIPMDPDNVIRNPNKWMQSIAFDSKDNIYVGWIMGGALSKYDRETKKVSVFPLPTPSAIVYGVVADRNDNIWAVEWNGGKIARFDTHNNSWTEFTPPTYPGHMRRGNIDYNNNYWVGIWAGGKRPGKLEKLDTATNRWTEYEIPSQNAQPYDVSADPANNIWSSDMGYTASLWKFNPQDKTFTFYPKPQRDTDSPKIQITKDGAVWYSPRTSKDHPAFGVLYPDMDKITTLGAYYLNGPPGYPFKTAVRTARQSGDSSPSSPGGR
jgi:streptogramin lyase